MTEEKFINPASTVDLLVERNNEGIREILLIERKHDPYKGCWALPGGFLDYKKENLEEAGVRELREETCLETKVEYLKLFKVSSEPDRDPRDHVISHAYVVEDFWGDASPADDAANLDWFPLEKLPSLAFDHREIVDCYKESRSYK